MHRIVMTFGLALISLTLATGCKCGGGSCGGGGYGYHEPIVGSESGDVYILPNETGAPAPVPSWDGPTEGSGSR